MLTITVLLQPFIVCLYWKSVCKNIWKITDEHQIKYIKNKIICLIYNNDISVPKLYNINCQYEQHKLKYDNYKGLMKQGKLEELKLGLKQ